MRSYILAVAGIVLIAALITLIAPSGKMGKFLQGAVKLAILAVMIVPFGALLKNQPPSVTAGTDIAADEGYLAYCAREKGHADAVELLLALEKEGISAEVKVERNADATFSYQKITVHVLAPVLSAADEHIYMLDQIEAALEAHYGCEAEVS